jgi:hypothetical protein
MDTVTRVSADGITDHKTIASGIMDLNQAKARDLESQAVKRDLTHQNKSLF